MSRIFVNIKKLTDTAHIPTKGSLSAAGADLYADIVEPLTINPHSTEKVSTGLAMAIPEGYFGGIYPRSGLATKKGLRPANCVGVIDSDYRGPVIVALHNDTDEQQTIEPQERIAQIIFQKYGDAYFNLTEELDDTARGDSGFGGSGRF